MQHNAIYTASTRVIECYSLDNSLFYINIRLSKQWDAMGSIYRNNMEA